MNDFEFSPETSSIEQPAQAEQRAEEVKITEYQAIPTAVSDDVPQQKADTPKSKSHNGIWITVTAVSLCLTLAMGIFFVWVLQRISSESQVQYNIPQSTSPSYNYRTDVNEGDELTTQEIIKKLNPSVVTVSVEIVSSQGKGTGFGTGIIYTENGYILTNAHVVESATAVSVKDYEGRSYKAKVVGMDSDSDVAVLKIEATGLTPAEFGESSKLVPGDKVVAIGTPYAQNLEYTATEGIVSALRNSVNFTELGYTLDLIQHDAAINSGNSGGPLINVYGQVVGINSIKISGTYENLGFALQIDAVLPIAEQLMSTGKIVRPGIGITGSTYSYGEISGVYIHSVTEGGPADNAGLKEGDVIIKADDTEIDSINRLKELINGHKIGDTINITYLRNDVVQRVDLTLTELNQD